MDVPAETNPTSSHAHPHGLTPQYFIDEFYNSLTHGVGALLSVAGLITLLSFAMAKGTAEHVFVCSVFGGSLVLLYTASAVYHSFHTPDLKRLLRIVDHSCIYVLIAGTYTPFALTLLRGGWGWFLFATVWGMTLTGIVFKIFLINRFETLSIFLYLAMGWIALIAIKPILERTPTGALVLLLAGGLAYTFGVIFYAKDKNPFFHAIWHCFVMAGSAFHFFAVFYYVIPV